MSAGAFKRTIAFLLDFMIVALAIIIIHYAIARPIYIRTVDDFDNLMDEFETVHAQYLEDFELLQTQFEANEITSTEFLEARDELLQTYRDMAPEAYRVRDNFIFFESIVLIGGFLVFTGLYHSILKGQSYGRKLLGLEYRGSPSPLNLIVREVFLKYFYWVFTLGFGIFVDIYMIILTRNKKTLRDMLTNSRILSDSDIVDPLQERV